WTPRRAMPPMDQAPDDDTLRELAATLGERLHAERHMLVTAESCTGGWIAKTMTDIAGSSDWFDCGLVAYSYEAKQAFLGVQPGDSDGDRDAVRRCTGKAALQGLERLL